MLKPSARAALAAVIGATLAVAALGANADAIKYRELVMKANGAHMGAMVQIAKGRVPHKAHMLRHAKALETNMSMVRDAFKAKTSGGKTTALPKIWTDWDGFQAKVKDAEKAANVLVRTIENGGDIGGALKGLGKTCGGCHKAYRKKKKK